MVSGLTATSVLQQFARKRPDKPNFTGVSQRRITNFLFKIKINTQKTAAANMLRRHILLKILHLFYGREQYSTRCATIMMR
jgi:hypothetical protein